MTIEQLAPNALWRHFAALCQIPRPSGHEEGVRRYLQDFAATHHLKCANDKAGNIVIHKAASAGNETAPGVILQGHMDMVPQKNMNVEFDFLRDPIRAYVDGDWVRAQGTTLGADNGIGVAAALAVLEDQKLDHGPLAALFTVEEETGLSGALNIDPAFLNGHYLINLDTEEEGEACISCAGGARTDFFFTTSWEVVPGAMNGVKIFVGGLLGGHSGMDINRGRGNAIKIMAKLLYKAQEQFGLRLTAIQGGNLDNAIPREAVATGWVPEDREMDLGEWLGDYGIELVREFKMTDPGIQINLSSHMPERRVWKAELQTRILTALADCVNGARRFNATILDLVETSSNLASVTTEPEQVLITTSQRSAIDHERDTLIGQLEQFFAEHGGSCRRRSSYPGWPVEAHSPLAAITQRVFERMFLRELKLSAIHAGLECGIFKGKNPALQMISIGPDVLAAHSPDERVRIESVKNFYRFLEQLLSVLAVP